MQIMVYVPSVNIFNEHLFSSRLADLQSLQRSSKESFFERVRSHDQHGRHAQYMIQTLKLVLQNLEIRNVALSTVKFKMRLYLFWSYTLLVDADVEGVILA